MDEDILKDLEDLNKKIDILFYSDLLSKQIINEHENRIKNLEENIK